MQGAAKMASEKRTSQVHSFSLPVTSMCQVTVQKKDLADFDGDAIVVTVTRSVVGRGGHSQMSNKVSRRAGEMYERERRMIGDTHLRPQDVIVTTAGDLKCNLILHAVQDRFLSKDRRKAEIKALLSEVLTKAGTEQLRTIAFPAIWEETSMYSFIVGIIVCVDW